MENLSTYQVAVTGLQGLVNCLTNLTGGRLPSTESQLAIHMHILAKANSAMIEMLLGVDYDGKTYGI